MEALNSDDGITTLNTVEEVDEVARVAAVVEKYLSRKLVQVQNAAGYDEAFCEDLLLGVEMAKVCVGFPNAKPVTLEKLSRDFESWKAILTEDIINFRRSIELAMQSASKRRQELLARPA